MSNLVFLYPHYLYYSSTFSLQTGTSGNEGSNVITGSRSNIFQRSGSGTHSSFRADTNNLISAERSPQYLYVAGLNLSTQKGGTTQISLVGADDSAITTNAVTALSQNFTTSNLIGVRKDDAIVEVATPANRRYWRARLTAVGADFSHECRKLYFGQWFDFNKNPVSLRVLNLVQARQNLRALTIRYKGITDSKLNFFKDRLYSNRLQNPVVLYERDTDIILGGDKVRMCYITDLSIRQITTNNNQIDVSLTEII